MILTNAQPFRKLRDYKELSESTRQIFKYMNKNFIIRVTFPNRDKTMLFSAEPYRLLINDDNIVFSHFKEVMDNGKQITTKKLRRGLKIDFVAK